MTDINIVKPIKKRYNNDKDRREAYLESKRKSIKRRRLIERKVLSEVEKINLKSFTNNTYQDDIFESIKDLGFSHSVTLKFNLFISVDYGKKAAQYFCDCLAKRHVTNNQLYVMEFGKAKHIHLHLALNFTKSFLELYSTDEAIKDYLYLVWNNETVHNGGVWVGELKTNVDKVNYLHYILKELLPLSRYHARQKQIDVWFIQSFNDAADAHEGKMLIHLNQILKDVNIKSIREDLNDFHGRVVVFKGREIVKQKITFKRVLYKYKHKLIPAFLAAVAWIFIC